MQLSCMHLKVLTTQTLDLPFPMVYTDINPAPGRRYSLPAVGGTPVGYGVAYAGTSTLGVWTSDSSPLDGRGGCSIVVAKIFGCNLNVMVSFWGASAPH